MKSRLASKSVVWTTGVWSIWEWERRGRVEQGTAVKNSGVFRAFKFKMATDIRREDSPRAQGGGRDLTLCVLTEKAAVQEQQTNAAVGPEGGVKSTA